MRMKDLYNSIMLDVNVLKNQVVLCISGRSCSGKTTKANQIQSILKELGISSVIICEDSWYKDLEDIDYGEMGFRNMESKGAFHITEFKNDMNTLLKFGIVKIPNYNISENKRISKDIVIEKKEVVILEGLHTIDIFRDLDKSDLSVYYLFIDTPLSSCVYRRIQRDNSLFGIPKEKIEYVYINVIDKHYSQYIENQKGIVKEKGSNGGVLS